MGFCLVFIDPPLQVKGSVANRLVIMIRQRNKSIFFKSIALSVIFLIPIFTYAHNLNKSDELQLLVVADQRDRQKKCSSLLGKQDWSRITQRDVERRRKVWEIFQKGHLKTSKDYLAAALIYQHGDRPAHYYQAYVWANTAVGLGACNKITCTNLIR